MKPSLPRYRNPTFGPRRDLRFIRRRSISLPAPARGYAHPARPPSVRTHRPVLSRRFAARRSAGTEGHDPRLRRPDLHAARRVRAGDHKRAAVWVRLVLRELARPTATLL